MPTATTGKARVHVNAPPEQVYALVSDVTRMGEWSPETNQCEWLDGATGPAVGVRFRGANHLGIIKWHTECVITAADPGREFSFTVMHPSGRESTVWRYVFTATDSGTDVVETYEFLWCPITSRAFETFLPRDKQLRAGIQHTLERLAAAAETNHANSH